MTFRTGPLDLGVQLPKPFGVAQRIRSNLQPPDAIDLRADKNRDAKVDFRDLLMITSLDPKSQAACSSSARLEFPEHGLFIPTLYTMIEPVSPASSHSMIGDRIAAPHVNRSPISGRKSLVSPTCSDSWSTACPIAYRTRVVLRDICTGKTEPITSFTSGLILKCTAWMGSKKSSDKVQTHCDTSGYRLDPIDAPDSRANLLQRGPDLDRPQSIGWLESFASWPIPEARRSITSKTTKARVAFTIVGSMMRIDLPQPLTVFQFEVKWSHRITPDAIRSHDGYEILDDGTGLYDWPNGFLECALHRHAWLATQEFLGRVNLEFGNYELHITVPENHVVAASGVLQNPEEVLTDQQQQRLDASRTSSPSWWSPKKTWRPLPESAKRNEPGGVSENVRDVAWANSPAFLMVAKASSCRGPHGP